MAFIPLPDAPSRADSLTFNPKMDAWVAALQAFSLGVNTLAGAADSAITASNYKGLWSSLTGPLTIPASVFYNNNYWILTTSVSDVTAKVPGAATEWVSTSPYPRLPIFSHPAILAKQVSSLDNIVIPTYTSVLPSVGGVSHLNGIFVLHTGPLVANANVASVNQATPSTSALVTMPSSAAWVVGSNGTTNMVAVAANGTAVATSTNGTTFTTASSLAAAAHATLALPVYASGVWGILGATGFYTSSNLAGAWSAVQTLPAVALSKVFSIGGLFWYWAGGTAAYTSATGATGSWTLATALPITPVASSIFVQTNASLTMHSGITNTPQYQSSNGTTWTNTNVNAPTSNGGIVLLNNIRARLSSTFGDCATIHNSAWVRRVCNIDLANDNATPWAMNKGVNLTLFSEGFDNAIWFKTLITVVPNTVVAPDGTLTADTLTKSSGIAYTDQDIVFGAGTTYTFSVYAKPATTSGYLSVLIQPVYASRVGATFNLNNGTVVGSAAAAGGGGSTVVSTSITADRNGFYRCVLTATTPGGTGDIYVGPTSNNGSFTDPFSGSILADVSLWGAQLQTGTAATAYQYTNAASTSMIVSPTPTGYAVLDLMALAAAPTAVFEL